MKLIDFMEFLYKTTTEEQIKWKMTTLETGEDTEMSTTVGVDSVVLTLNPYQLKIGKYSPIRCSFPETARWQLPEITNVLSPTIRSATVTSSIRTPASRMPIRQSPSSPQARWMRIYFPPQYIWEKLRSQKNSGSFILIYRSAIKIYAQFPIKLGDAGERKNFFSREEKFFPSPAPPSFFKKSEIWLLQSCPAIAFGEDGWLRCYH